MDSKRVLGSLCAMFTGENRCKNLVLSDQKGLCLAKRMLRPLQLPGDVFHRVAQALRDAHSAILA